MSNSKCMPHVLECVSRRIQVTPKWSKYQQTPVERGTQTTEIISYKDTILLPSLNYQTAEELIAEQEVKVTEPTSKYKF